jgi:hypothetical protein
MYKKEWVKLFKEPSEEDKSRYGFPSIDEQINDYFFRGVCRGLYEVKDYKLSEDGKTCLVVYLSSS